MTLKGIDGGYHGMTDKEIEDKKVREMLDTLPTSIEPGVLTREMWDAGVKAIMEYDGHDDYWRRQEAMYRSIGMDAAAREARRMRLGIREVKER